MLQNNNGDVIKCLAKKGLGADKKRNCLVMIIIASVSCLMMSLSMATTGKTQAQKNDAKNSAQVVFYKVSEDIVDQLRNEPDIDWIGENLIIASHIKNNDTTLQINYVSPDLYKKGIIKSQRLEFEGTSPIKQNEIVVMSSFLSHIGSTAKIGDTVPLDLGDGVKREYRITGLLSTDLDTENRYVVDVSKACAKMLMGNSTLTVNANIWLRNPESISQGKAELIANKWAKKYSIPKSNVTVRSTYFNVMNNRFGFVDLAGTGFVFVLLLGAGLVIYTIFYISVSGKTKEYGMLRTIGMTKKQIKKLVSLEGRYLSAIGILPGLVIGCIIGFFIAPDGWRLFATLISAAAISILTFITVAVSVRVPAKMASQVSPIEATRYLEWSGGEKSSQKLHRSLTPARLALMNFSRNKKKSILTVVSLAVSGILLLCVSTFSYSYNAEVDARNDFPYGDFQITIKDSGDLSAGSNDEWNYSRLKIKNPLNASLREKMLQIDGVAGIQDETAIHVQFTLPDGTALSGAIKGFNAKDSVAMQSKVIAGTLDYQTLCEKNGIAIAKCKIKNYTPQLGDKISLQYLKADGTTSMQDFTVMAILSDYQNPFGLPIALPTDTMNTLSGFDHIDTYYVKTSPDKEKNVQAALNKIIAVNNNLELNTFKEAVDYKKSLMEPQIVIFYGLSLIVIIFGLINLLNTTITNFISRQREIGILQAIGLTGKQLNFMFWTEGICYTAGASALTLIFGTLLGYAGFWILLPIKNYYQYRFPVIPALEFIGIMLIMQIVISVFTVCNMKKQSLVERIEQRT